MIQMHQACLLLGSNILPEKKLTLGLNPLIGYSQGVELVKEAAIRKMTIYDIAVEKAKDGTLIHVDGDRLIIIEEIEAALGDLQRLR